MYSLYNTWGFPCEFPHSEIFGSLVMCTYQAQNFPAYRAYHFLHRLDAKVFNLLRPLCLTYLFIFYEPSLQYTKNISWIVVFIQTIYYVQFSKNMLCASKSMIWLRHLYSSALLREFLFERYLVSQN